MALLIGGVVVTETVYAIPGLGSLTVDAVLNRDFPVSKGLGVYCFSVSYCGWIQFDLVDVSYLWFFDPRIRLLAMNTLQRLPQKHSPCAVGAGVLGVLVASRCWPRGWARWTLRPWTRPTSTICGFARQLCLLDGSNLAHTFWFGSDSFGRDIYSRVLYGTRVSLTIGLTTALVAIGIGALLGMMAGYFRPVDAVLMRFMDGLMAIPSILLAIALVAALGAQLWTVVVAIAIPEIPRVTRLVRSLVLTLREEPFVEAAKALATPTHVILWRHILPNAMAPVDCAGHFCSRGCGADRSGAQLSGPGPAGRHSYVGQHHG